MTPTIFVEVPDLKKIDRGLCRILTCLTPVARRSDTMHLLVFFVVRMLLTRISARPVLVFWTWIRATSDLAESIEMLGMACSVLRMAWRLCCLTLLVASMANVWLQVLVVIGDSLFETMMALSTTGDVGLVARVRMVRGVSVV